MHRRDQFYALPVKGSEIWKEWIGDRRATHYNCYEVVTVERPIWIGVARYVPDTAGVALKDIPLCLVGLSLE